MYKQFNYLVICINIGYVLSIKIQFYFCFSIFYLCTDLRLVKYLSKCYLDIFKYLKYVSNTTKKICFLSI